MADERQGGDAQFEEHEVVKALVPDPTAAPPDATVLEGFVGRGSAPEVRRLYLNPELSDYVAIPTDVILHVQDTGEGGPTRVWVRRDVPLKHVTVTSEEVQARFLGGSISEHYLAAPGRRAVPGALTRHARTEVCTEFGPRCPTGPIGCPTGWWRCPDPAEWEVPRTQGAWGCPSFARCPWGERGAQRTEICW